MVDAGSCRQGAYDPLHDDPFAPGDGLARPVLSFFEAATVVVSLDDRPVRARFSAGKCGAARDQADTPAHSHNATGAHNATGSLSCSASMALYAMLD